MPETIIHFGAVTLRLNGTGSLKMTMFSLDKARMISLIPFTMIPFTDIEPTRLCNFVTQRAVFRGETNNIDEFMKINRVILHTRPMWTQYPGNV